MKPYSSVLVEKAGLASTECDDTEFFFYSFPIGFGLAVFVTTHVHYAFSVVVPSSLT